MMVIVNLYLACTALVLMLIEDAPLQDDHGHAEGDERPPTDMTSAEVVAPRA